MRLRQQYHFGPNKIEIYLRRYHDISVGHATINRILHRLGLNELPANQRYQHCQRKDERSKRDEKQQPGNRVQIDATFVEPIGEAEPKVSPVTGKAPKQRRRAGYYQFTAIDDGTGVFNDKPNGALAGQTPYERRKQRPRPTR